MGSFLQQMAGSDTLVIHDGWSYCAVGRSGNSPGIQRDASSAITKVYDRI